MSDVLDRFLRYCAIPSQSNPLTAKTVPSTPAQFDMAREVQQDLEELGAENVTLDEHAYVIAHWPASSGAEHMPTLGFCCHVDTAWQSWADPVYPQVKHYKGGELLIGTGRDGKPVVISPATNPQLANMRGYDLVTSDGTSLLGGDDKAGIAVVISLLARLRDNPQLPHPRLALCFAPDEEIGHGARLLDLETFGAAYGYTLDAGPIGEFCYETFNAARAHVVSHGISVHTGTAKNVMVNASEALMRFHQFLPPHERPEYTEGYEGFYYLSDVAGNCEQAEAYYIIRDHNRTLLEHKKDVLSQAIVLTNAHYKQEVLTIEIVDEYRNMADVLTLPENAHLIEHARAAYQAIGVEMFSIPMRGGTDGAQLSFRGLPCANLSACYYNAHGVREFVPVPELEAMVDMLEALVGSYAHA